MKNLKTLLQDADPVRREVTTPLDAMARQRQAILGEAIRIGKEGETRNSRRLSFLAVAMLAAIAAPFFVPGLRSLFIEEVHAAVKFEVRLAEDHPSPGLQEAKVTGTDQTVYLSRDVVVTNGDILRAEVAPGSNPSQFSVSIEFTPGGGRKIQSATGSHIGKRIAILLDDQVVMALTIRSPIASSAVITGKFTKAEAERIVNGLR